jgi:Sugar-transfer associated ATP-grasp
MNVEYVCERLRTRSWLRDADVHWLVREVAYRLNAVVDTLSLTAAAQRNELGRHRGRRDLLGQLVLAICGGFAPREYYLYDVATAQSLSTVLSEYIGYYRRWEYRERRSRASEAARLRNKITCIEYLHSRGLPTTTVRAIYLSGSWFTRTKVGWEERDRASLAVELRDSDCLYKPLCGRWGRDVGLLPNGGARGLTQDESDARFVGLSQSLERIELRARNEPFVIENRLYNHRDFPSSLKSLSTVRVMTCRVRSSEIIPFAAALRWAPGDSIVDNWSAGGLAASVDLQSGLVGSSYAKEPVRREVSAKAPTSDIPPVAVVPDWAAILSLAKRAHSAFLGIQSVGWDIAITANGPVIIEGNDDWDIVLPQRVLRAGLWTTPFHEAFP